VWCDPWEARTQSERPCGSPSTLKGSEARGSPCDLPVATFFAVCYLVLRLVVSVAPSFSFSPGRSSGSVGDANTLALVFFPNPVADVRPVA